MLARALGADGRGALAAALVLPQILSYAIFLGLPRTLSISVVHRGRSSTLAFLLLGLLGIVGSLAIWCVAPQLSAENDATLSAIRLSAAAFVLAGFGRLGADHLVDRGLTGWVNTQRACALIVPSVIQIGAFALGGLTFWMAFGSIFAGNLLGIGVAAVGVTPVARALSRDTPVDIVNNVRLSASIILDSVASRTDQLALALLSNPSQLGVYAVAFTCASAAGAGGQAINQVYYARVVRRLSDGGAASGRAVRRIVAIRIALTMASGLAIAALAWRWGTRLLGSDYSQLGLIIAILLLAQVAWDQWQWQHTIAIAAEETRVLPSASLVGMLVLCVCVGIMATSHGDPAVLMAVAVVCGNVARVGYYAWSIGRSTG